MMPDIFNIGPYKCYFSSVKGNMSDSALRTDVICVESFNYDKAIEVVKYLCSALKTYNAEIQRLHPSNKYAVIVHSVRYSVVVDIMEVTNNG